MNVFEYVPLMRDTEGVAAMIGVGLLLTLVASAASVLFIMRYDPLKILANRD